MKLLLTSAGLANAKIVSALHKLHGKPLKGAKVVFVPTASNVEPGNKDWLIEDYVNCMNAGLEVDIVDISALDKATWLPRLESANILFFGGGKTMHLMHWLTKSGLQQELPRLLKTRVYAGISAGSCVTGPSVFNSVQNLFDEEYEVVIDKGLGLVEFQVIPHLNSKYFPKIRTDRLKLASEKISEPVYALDDNCAVVVDGKSVEVVGGGEWVRF